MIATSSEKTSIFSFFFFEIVSLFLLVGIPKSYPNVAWKLISRSISAIVVRARWATLRPGHSPTPGWFAIIRTIWSRSTWCPRASVAWPAWVTWWAATRAASAIAWATPWTPRARPKTEFCAFAKERERQAISERNCVGHENLLLSLN